MKKRIEEKMAKTLEMSVKVINSKAITNTTRNVSII